MTHIPVAGVFYMCVCLFACRVNCRSELLVLQLSNQALLTVLKPIRSIVYSNYVDTNCDTNGKLSVPTIDPSTFLFSFQALSELRTAFFSIDSVCTQYRGSMPCVTRLSAHIPVSRVQYKACCVAIWRCRVRWMGWHTPTGHSTPALTPTSP